MVSLNPSQVVQHLSGWYGEQVYIHLEVNRGGYWRNGNAHLTKAHVKGDGPYRVFLELNDSSGLIQLDDVTHMSLTSDLVICTGYDEQGRLARTVEVGRRPFAV